MRTLPLDPLRLCPDTVDRKSARSPRFLFVVAILALTGCARRDGVVRRGSTVRFDYSLSIDGKPFESSSAPLEIVEDSGEVVPGLEELLLGMKAGESKHASVPPEKGYGAVDASKIQSMPASAFDKSLHLAPGMTVEGLKDGKAAAARVTRMDKDLVTLDFNHPLAGKTLDFEIRVLVVR